MEIVLHFFTRLFELLQAFGAYIQNEPVQAVAILFALTIAVVVLRAAFAISLKIAAVLVVGAAIIIGGVFLWNYGSNVLDELTDESGGGGFWADEFGDLIGELAKQKHYDAYAKESGGFFRFISLGGNGDPLVIPKGTTYQEGIKLLRQFAREDTREVAYFFYEHKSEETRWELAAVGSEKDAGMHVHFDALYEASNLKRVYFIHTHPQSLSSYTTLPPSGIDVVAVMQLLRLLKERPLSGNPEFVAQVVDAENLWTYDVSGAVASMDAILARDGEAAAIAHAREVVSAVVEQERIYLCGTGTITVYRCEVPSTAERTAAIAEAIRLWDGFGVDITRTPIDSGI